MNYRGYDIKPCDYGGFLYAQPDAESWHWTGQSGTLATAKDEIDTIIFEATSYRVVRETRKSRTITKFNFIAEAVAFAAKYCAPVEMYVSGQRVHLDLV